MGRFSNSKLPPTVYKNLWLDVSFNAQVYLFKKKSDHYTSSPQLSSLLHLPLWMIGFHCLCSQNRGLGWIKSNPNWSCAGMWLLWPIQIVLICSDVSKGRIPGLLHREHGQWKLIINGDGGKCSRDRDLGQVYGLVHLLDFFVKGEFTL